jgi:pyruvate/2-oxoglutarate dehydrogenase complex dihydrolipoamide acyltransferase (E2) component
LRIEDSAALSSDKKPDSKHTIIEDIMSQQKEVFNELLSNQAPKCNAIIKIVLSTPAVRHLIKDHNLNPKLITPTGKGGRILKEDVINYIEKAKTPIPPMHAQFQMEHKGVTVNRV